MFWRIGWQHSSKRPQGLGWSCTYRMSLAIWCLQGTAWGIGLGLGRVGFTYPLCVAIGASRFPAEVGRRGLLRLVLSFLTWLQQQSGAETDAVSSPEPQRCPRPGVRASFPVLVRAACSGSCDSRCSVRSLVLSLFSPRGAGSTVLPSLLGIATHVLVWVPGGPSLALVRGAALAARVEICTEAGFAGLGNGPILVSFAAQPCSFHGPQFFFCAPNCPSTISF